MRAFKRLKRLRAALPQALEPFKGPLSANGNGSEQRDFVGVEDDQNLFWVTGFCAGKETKFLVDSGSSRCLISEHYLNTLPLSSSISVRPYSGPQPAL